MNNTFKTILVLAFFSFLGIQRSAAQGNLQFNQVKIFDLPSNGPATTFTVPVGKVWKIESAGAGATCTVYLQNSSAISMTVLYLSSASSTMSPFPIWLPTGFTGGFFYSNGCAPLRGMVSVIEFNVIP